MKRPAWDFLRGLPSKRDDAANKKHPQKFQHTVGLDVRPAKLGHPELADGY